MNRARWALGLALGGCAAPEWQKTPHDLPFQSAPPPTVHVAPERTQPTDWWYTVEQTTTHPLGSALSPIHWIDQARGEPLAHDINDFGEVLDSPWFTNRIGRKPMSVAEVARGPNTLDGPAPGPLLVLSGKLSGASPGLVLEDQEGNRFVAKFDPPAYPGLASSAEVVTTKILHAAGYNVPENYVVRFSSDRLVLSEGAVGPARHGRVTPLTEDSLDDLMMLANPMRGGVVQALFSRILRGKDVGPFSYEGVRFDDPNDTIPHERRRSLRGYRWFCAWTNNTDTRASNTLDVFRTVDGERGYLVHYLIDFGNSLGSLGTKPKYQSDGYEPIISWGVLGELFFTVGLRYRYWLPAQRSPYRSVGMFEGEVFNPRLWSPSIPNPAFEVSTPLDDYWAAAIMARFSREMIDAIVEEAAFERPRAATYVADVLWKRREKILQMAFARVAPLDLVGVDGWQLRFVDYAILNELEPAADVSYDYEVRAYRGRQRGPLLDRGRVRKPVFDLAEIIKGRSAENWTRDPFLSLELKRRTRRGEQAPLHLHLRWMPDGLRGVGLEREVE